MNNLSKVTDNRKLVRYYNLDLKSSNLFTKHNDALKKQFECISNFSELLPDNLNKLAILADMITDSMTVSGKTSLSKSVSQLSREEFNTSYNKESGTLTLKSTVEQDYTINKNKTFIESINTYNIFNIDNTSLLTFSDLFTDNSISLQTDNLFFKYTFVLTLDHIATINNINIKLNKLTDSYPLISEIYYLDSENKRQYCTILNSSETSYDLDTDRYTDNDYNVLINPVNSSRIFITFEDKGNSTLIIDKIKLQKLTYEPSGYIIFGPVVSTSHILKAAVEAAGDIDGASFYISTDKVNWTEIALPNQLSLDAKINKIISYNTISTESIKKDFDVNEIYLKVDLIQLKVKDAVENLNYSKVDFNSDTITFDNSSNVKDITVYRKYKDIFYGDTNYSSQTDGINIYNKEISFIETKGKTLIKSFISQEYSYLVTDTLYSCITNTKPLKIGGDLIPAYDFEPVTSIVYGYTNTIKHGYINTNIQNNICLLLKEMYVRDVYKVIQNNREIEIDLRLGFISSSLEVVIGVDKEFPVYLYDSTGTLVKILEIQEFENLNYISLIDSDMFILPTSDKYIFNSLFPIKLNSAIDFGILKGSVVSVDSLIYLENYTEVTKESIPYAILLSKENGNALKLTDNLLRDKYIEKTEELVKAYNENIAIKLRNQNIKKGSFNIIDTSKSIRKNYLKEVGFNNGASEFKSFRTFKNTFNITSEDVSQSFKITLTDLEINFETVAISLKNKYEIPLYWRHINGEAENQIEIYTTGSFSILPTDSIEISYIALNTATSNLYSVDYDRGILYLANATNVDLKIEYSFYNLMLFGRKSEQLGNDKYQASSSLVRVSNYTEGFNYTAVISLSTNRKEEYVTPFISNIKLNYLNTSEQESF